MTQPTYLDYNATAPVRPEVKAAVNAAMDILGNPASVHAGGRAARALVETSRADVANLVGVKPASITFTSGGTESNALAIESAVLAGYDRIILGATEHSAVTENALAKSSAIEVWPVLSDGQANLGWLHDALRRPGKALVCLMLANNETGVIQPVEKTATLVREAGGWLHVDAVGAVGKIVIDFNALGADTMALVSHKLGGPFGIGALAAGPRSKLSRLMHGGGQEQGRRGGAENVSGIAGFAAAAKAAVRDLPSMANQAVWRDALQARVQAAGATLFGNRVPRLPQTLGFGIENFPASLQVMNLDLAGIMVSAGPACSSGKLKPSATITAMGREDLAANTIRVSGGWATTAEDWARCGDIWLEILAKHAARHGARLQGAA
jgi:cysteine desulfurase